MQILAGSTLRSITVLTVLSLLVLLATFPQASAQVGTSITIDSAQLVEDGQGSVEVRALDVLSPGLGAWLVDVIYDPSVVTAIDCTPQQPPSVCNEAFTDDTVRIAGADGAGVQRDFSLATILFACKTPGVSTLTIIVSTFADTLFNPIGPMIGTGTIVCGTLGVPGDANCDGIVDPIDAALILQFGSALLGALPCPASSDVNRDGNINAIDAALVLQFAAGLLNGLPP